MNWISVKERLPDDMNDVLLFGKLSRVSLPSVFVGYRIGDSEWKALGLGSVASVTHWMPMPAGPVQD